MKKLLSCVLMLVMVFSMAITAFAFGNADASVSVYVDGNNLNQGNLVITVTDSRGSYALTLEKPGANNSQTGIVVGPYIVDIIINGNNIGNKSITGHNCVYDSAVTSPSCLDGGFTTYTCYICDDEYTGNVVGALGHRLVTRVIEPTCTEAGRETVFCNRADCDYKVVTVIPALGHRLATRVTEPTCTEAGRETVFCNRADCDYKVVTVIPALGHTTGLSNAKFVSITETSKGSRVWTLAFTATKTCSVCGDTDTVNLSVNLNGNNANLSGKADLGNGYTIVYDIKGNGSNIKDFIIVKN